MRGFVGADRRRAGLCKAQGFRRVAVAMRAVLRAGRAQAALSRLEAGALRPAARTYRTGHGHLPPPFPPPSASSPTHSSPFPGKKLRPGCFVSPGGEVLSYSPSCSAALASRLLCLLACCQTGESFSRSEIVPL